MLTTIYSICFAIVTFLFIVILVVGIDLFFVNILDISILSILKNKLKQTKFYKKLHNME